MSRQLLAFSEGFNETLKAAAFLSGFLTKCSEASVCPLVVMSAINSEPTSVEEETPGPAQEKINLSSGKQVVIHNHSPPLLFWNVKHAA